MGACSAALLAISGCELGDGNAYSTTTRANSSGKADAPSIQNDRGPRGYVRLLSGSFNLLNTYWGNQLLDLGADDAGPPLRLISYWNRSEDPGCGGRKSGPRNAVYCQGDETISWDGNWMQRDLYRRSGDAAVMFVLAHEYGHLVQDRLGIFNAFRHSIEAELNADCLAGAWLGSIDRKVARFNQADFRSLYAGVLNVADPRWVPWRNPSAHGNANERSHSIDIGATRGQRECLRRYGPGFTR